MQVLTLLFSLFLWLFWVSTGALKVGDFDFPLGQEQGVSSTSSSLSSETLQRILDGVAAGNPDNIYFLGLLKLYGISMVMDAAGAAQQFARASALGHRDATTAQGVLLLSGSLGYKDPTEAVRFFREASRMGDMNAHWLLGMMLMEGKGIAPNYVEAAVHLQAAAAHQVPQALHCLALLYEYGRGIAQDLEQAIALYERAVEFNQAESMYNLALMHMAGRGTPQSYHRARALLETAAITLKHAPSRYFLGVFCTYGYAGPVQYENAIRHFEIAAASDDARIGYKARESAKELRMWVERANQVNQETLEKIRERATSPR